MTKPAQSVQPLQDHVKERRAVKFSELVNHDALANFRRKVGCQRVS
jgi:hypothetical protein